MYKIYTLTWDICMQAIFSSNFPPSLTLLLPRDDQEQFLTVFNFVCQKNAKFSLNFHFDFCFHYFANNVRDKWIERNTSWDWIHPEVSSRTEMFSAGSLQSKLSRRWRFEAEQTSLSGVLSVQGIMLLVYLLYQFWILPTLCKLLGAWNSSMPLVCQWPGGN